MIKAEVKHIGTENDKSNYRTKIHIDDDDEEVLFETASLIASIFIHWAKVITPD